MKSSTFEVVEYMSLLIFFQSVPLHNSSLRPSPLVASAAPAHEERRKLEEIWGLRSCKRVPD